MDVDDEEVPTSSSPTSGSISLLKFNFMYSKVLSFIVDFSSYFLYLVPFQIFQQCMTGLLLNNLLLMNVSSRLHFRCLLR